MACLALLLLIVAPLSVSGLTVAPTAALGGAINDIKNVAGGVGVTIAPNVAGINAIAAIPGQLINGTIGTAADLKAQLDYKVTELICNIVKTILAAFEAVLVGTISTGTSQIGNVGGAVAGAGNSIGSIPVGFNANMTAQVIVDLTKIVVAGVTVNPFDLEAALIDMLNILAGAGASLQFGAVLGNLGTITGAGGLAGLVSGLTGGGVGTGIAF